MNKFWGDLTDISAKKDPLTLNIQVGTKLCVSGLICPSTKAYPQRRHWLYPFKSTRCEENWRWNVTIRIAGQDSYGIYSKRCRPYLNAIDRPSANMSAANVAKPWQHHFQLMFLPVNYLASACTAMTLCMKGLNTSYRDECMPLQGIWQDAGLQIRGVRSSRFMPAKLREEKPPPYRARLGTLTGILNNFILARCV